MKRVKRWRYCCDHCKKSGGSGGHMKNHELICTANPDRKCGLCKMAEQVQAKTQDMTDLINKYISFEKWPGFGDEDGSNIFNDGVTAKDILKELRELTNNCPACILTAIRLTKTSSLFLKEDFDFHAERKEFFDINKSSYDYDGY